jgi:diguanylate cyclase (GGDEF)-like protein
LSRNRFEERRAMTEGPGSRGRILLVEDEDLMRWSVGRYLEKRNFTVDAAADGTEGLRKASSGTYDLLITDLQIRGLDGLSLAAAARQRNPRLQVIVITGHGSKETVLDALRQGVWDYVEKPFDLEVLMFTIDKALEKSRMEEELLRLSRTDGLTGLYNQRHFYSILGSEMKRAARQKKKLALLLIDVDDFKEYNDRHGHLAGDDLLVHLAACMKKSCRGDVDLAFRYGGDEFVILLPEADRDVAQSVAERLCHYLRAEKAGVTVSIGLTELKEARDLREAIREADEAMYLAKQFGGDRTIIFERSS